MKKILLIAAALLCAGISMKAQDMAEATETAKAANEALMNGDNAAALSSFQAALEMAENCGGEGLDLVATCQGIIPKILLSMAKGEIKAGELDKAIETLGKTVEKANEYGNAEVANDAQDLIPGVYMSKANRFLAEKDFAGAVDAFNKVLENNPTNGIAALKLGQAYTALGQNDEAVAAFELAMANGQEKNAAKLLSTNFLKEAQTALKAGKYADVIAAAEKSNEYLPNANANKLAASAATKLGKSADAIGYYKAYLELAPTAKDAIDVTYTVAVLAQKAGDKATAREFYEKLVSDVTYGGAAKTQLKTL